MERCVQVRRNVFKALSSLPEAFTRTGWGGGEGRGDKFEHLKLQAKTFYSYAS
jgi:hypothetical protein